MADEPDILFVSLGMFIIDTIIDIHGIQLDDIIGGAGTYAAIGSRMFSKSQETGFIVDFGNDVPASVQQTLSSLDLALEIRRDESRRCTRGLNTYKGDLRLFEYLTPKIRISPDQLSPRFLRARSFHLICAPQRCIDVVESLRHLRAQAKVQERPLTIWEPVPDACIPENKDDFARAVKYVDVVSPNMAEAVSLLDEQMQADQESSHSQIESIAAEIVEMGIETVIIRCSAMGAYVHATELKQWFPAFIADPVQVIDATGAGNTFCGAFVTKLAQRADMHEAMSCASVAAGLSIQQVGPPMLKIVDCAEKWNGSNIEHLLEMYKSRLIDA